MKHLKMKKIFGVLLSCILLFAVCMLPAAAGNMIGRVDTATSPLRVRTGPGTTHGLVYSNNVLVQIPKGDYITILDTVPCDDSSASSNPIWYYMTAKFNGATVKGYVSATYVTIIDDGSEEGGGQEPGVDEGQVSGGTADLSEVPDIYKPYLAGIMARHPNWKFEFFYTGLDWNTVIKNETTLGRSLTSRTRDGYRSKMLGAYNPATGEYIAQDGSSWFQAADEVVEYYMDPRNSMTDARIFQFERLSYEAGVQTLSGIQNILKGSFMENATILTDDGRRVTYAQAIMEAAQTSGASPYHLAARIIQEVGRNGSGSTSGTYVGKDGTSYAGYYNFYNIGASSSADPIATGLSWAKGGTTYNRPWTSPYKSIVGGAQYIARNYINEGQDTQYLQKFDVESEYNGLYWHQYMTNIEAAYSESNTMYKNYVQSGLLESEIIFKIPVYNNMPVVCHLPDFATGDVRGNRRGDANDDGSVSAADYAIVKDAAVEFDYIATDGNTFIARDVNDDGAIDAFDAAELDLIIHGLK